MNRPITIIHAPRERVGLRYTSFCINIYYNCGCDCNHHCGSHGGPVCDRCQRTTSPPRAFNINEPQWLGSDSKQQIGDKLLGSCMPSLTHQIRCLPHFSCKGYVSLQSCFADTGICGIHRGYALGFSLQGAIATGCDSSVEGLTAIRPPQPGIPVLL